LLDDSGDTIAEDPQLLNIDAVVHVGIAGEVARRLRARGDHTGRVVALVVDTSDGDLDHALPEGAVVVRGVVPDVLETLMGLEESLLVPQPPSRGQCLLDGVVLPVLRQVGVGGVVREWTTRPVPRAGVLGPTPGVAIADDGLLRSLWRVTAAPVPSARK
jgi:hypothetical protein